MNAILPRMRYDTIEEDTAVATEEIRNHREIRLSTEKDVWSLNVSTRRGRAREKAGEDGRNSDRRFFDIWA